MLKFLCYIFGLGILVWSVVALITEQECISFSWSWSVITDSQLSINVLTLRIIFSCMYELFSLFIFWLHHDLVNDFWYFRVLHSNACTIIRFAQKLVCNNSCSPKHFQRRQEKAHKVSQLGAFPPLKLSSMCSMIFWISLFGWP